MLQFYELNCILQTTENEPMTGQVWHGRVKGTVQRKLAGVENDINRKVFLSSSAL
jgi:hypothetical protein